MIGWEKDLHLIEGYLYLLLGVIRDKLSGCGDQYQD